MHSFYLLLSLFVFGLSNDNSKSIYISFIGNETELQFCQNALDLLISNKKQQFCEEYAPSFGFSCNNDDTLSLVCDINFTSIPSETTDLRVSVGSIDTISINMTSVPTTSNISISPFQNTKEEEEEAQCITLSRSIKLIGINEESSITIENMKVSFGENSITKLIKFISCDIESNSQSYSEIFLVDECTALKNPYKSYKINYFVLNTTSDSPATITFSENGYNFSIGNKNYLISNNVQREAYLYSRTKEVTLHIDQPNPEYLNDIGIAYSGTDNPTLTLRKSGNWDFSLQKKISIHCKYLEDKIIISSQDKRIFNVIFNDLVYPQKRDVTCIVATGEDLEQCKVVKQDIENDVNNCQKYENIYHFYCGSNFVLYCEDNETSFEDIGTDNLESVFVIILNYTVEPMIIDISKTPNIQFFQIVALNCYEDETEEYVDPITTITVKGGNISNIESLYFASLKVKIIERNLTIRKLSFFTSEILESDYYFHSDEVEGNGYFISHYPSNNPPIAKAFVDDVSKSKLKISFTKDKWALNFYRHNEKKDLLISYNIADKLKIYLDSGYVTFHVENSFSAQLKTIELYSCSDFGTITFISEGDWSYPLEKPLNIILSEYSYFYYFNTDYLDLKWFNFDIEDIHHPPFQPSKTYNYFIGDGNELQQCQNRKK